MDWKTLEQLGPVLISVIVGLSFAVYIATALSGGFGANTASANVINTILSGLSTELTTFWPIILIAVFIGIAYIALRGSGLVGGGRNK